MVHTWDGDGEGVGNRGDECSVNGGDGERLLTKLFPTLFENVDKRSVVSSAA